MMQIYVRESREAVELYIKAFNAELGYNVKSPDGP
jgi:PhnB protein